MCLMVCFEALEKIIVSSAHCRDKILFVKREGPKPTMRLLEHTRCNMRFKMFATKMNKYGDRGSPRLCPCLVLIHQVSSPLISKAILVEKRRLEIQEYHLTPKPLTLKRFRRRCQSTLSKLSLLDV